MKKEKEMTESEKKRSGCYFNPKAEIQRKEIIKNLNKTSENEKLMRFKRKERR
ncbi:MAG TPA: hypothetical protein VFD40_01625 [Candidatus Paceibacterota bacterium]|nr:hypothetical protein [Candidatus Paceibacterota bacterium]